MHSNAFYIKVNLDCITDITPWKDNEQFNNDLELALECTEEIKMQGNVNNHHCFCEAAPASKVFDSRIEKQCGSVPKR